MEAREKNLRVLDSSGILHSDMDFSAGGYLVTPGVLGEILSVNARLALENAIGDGRVKVIAPGNEAIENVRRAARESGDLTKLSDVDVGVLALALEKKATIKSDDYRIQNVAASLGVEYIPTVQEGIKERYRWEKRCPGCGRRQADERKVCEVCGTELKLKKRRL